MITNSLVCMTKSNLQANQTFRCSRILGLKIASGEFAVLCPCWFIQILSWFIEIYSRFIQITSGHFFFKNPLVQLRSPAVSSANFWAEKIASGECLMSMLFYPKFQILSWFIEIYPKFISIKSGHFFFQKSFVSAEISGCLIC